MLFDLEKQLISYWAKTLKCRECSLPKRYRPQLRPVGIDYKVGGVLFLQINPGEIGSLTKSKIKQRYTTTTERKIACYKNQGTKKLLALQDVFAHRPIVGNWRKLAKAYNEIMQEVWGRPPGKYKKTIEQHGVPINTVAIANIAKCPAPNNKYGFLLQPCWEKRTKELIEILKPSTIVAQSKSAYRFVIKQPMSDSVKIIEGVHHASRLRRAENELIFRKVSRLLKSNRFFDSMTKETKRHFEILFDQASKGKHYACQGCLRNPQKQKTAFAKPCLDHFGLTRNGLLVILRDPGASSGGASHSGKLCPIDNSDRTANILKEKLKLVRVPKDSICFTNAILHGYFDKNSKENNENERKRCRIILREFHDLLRPKVVLALGLEAIQSIIEIHLNQEIPRPTMKELIDREFYFGHLPDVKVFGMPHPAYANTNLAKYGLKQDDAWESVLQRINSIF